MAPMVVLAVLGLESSSEGRRGWQENLALRLAVSMKERRPEGRER